MSTQLEVRAKALAIAEGERRYAFENRTCDYPDHRSVPKLLSGGCRVCFEVYMAGVDAKVGLMRLTCAERGTTKGEIYNYSYWACPHCRYYPGSSEGPPPETCLNCRRPLYVNNAADATYLIELTRTSISGSKLYNYGFRIVYTFNGGAPR